MPKEIAPVLTEQINGYTIQWEKPNNLLARITRVRVHSDSRVTGELEFTHNNSSGTLILLPGSDINFSAEQTRNRLAKSLTEKWESLKLTLNWQDILDYLGYNIPKLARAGDTPEEIWAEDDAPPPNLLLDPLIYEGHQNMIFGEKGVAKSTLVYAAAMSIAIPDWLNPLELTVSSSPLISLVLDWETDKATFRYYLSRLKRGMNAPDVGIFYRRCHLPLAQDIEAVQDHITRTKADLLIIDSLGAAAGGEAGELGGSQAPLLFNSTLRKLNRTSLIIGQTSKSETGKKSVYGSTYFRYYARNIFELCQGEEQEDNVQHLALFHRDCNFSQKARPIGLRLTYGENKAISIEREPVSIAEFTEKFSTSKRVVDFLKAGQATAEEVAGALNLSLATARVHLSNLKKKGTLVKIEDSYGLAYDDEIKP